MSSVDPFAGLKKAKEDYKVYDSHYEKIGKVDDLLVDDGDEVLYVGVKMGFLGTNSTIIPTEILRVNDRRQLIEVSEPAETIKHAPDFKHGDELTPELERHVRSYYGLESTRPAPEHAGGSYDAPRNDPRVDVVPGERSASGEGRAAESPTPPPRRSVDIPLDDDVPEFTPERTSESSPRRSPQRPPERPARRVERPAEEVERPAARRIERPTGGGERTTGGVERPGREADDRWETEEAGDGVRVHRLRR